MKCNKVKRLISAYLDKELSPKKIALIKEHLDLCFNCQETYQSLLSLKKLFLERKQKEIPPGYFVYKVWEKLILRKDLSENLLFNFAYFSKKFIFLPASLLFIFLLIFLTNLKILKNSYSLEDYFLSNNSINQEIVEKIILESID